MIVGNVTQTESILEIDTNMIGYQWSENLQLQVTYDDTYKGWSKKWDAIGSNKKKRIPLAYDDTSKTITLNKACFEDDMLFISCAFVQNGVVANTNLIRLYIGESVNHGLDTVPDIPGLYDEMRDLFEQINENEYRKPIYELIAKAQTDIDKFIADGTIDMEELKKSTTGVLDKLKLDYATYINNMTTKYDQDRVAMLENAAKQIQAMKDSANAAIDTMIKNANIDFKALKDTTTTDVNDLKKQAQAQQTQIDVSRQSMDTLQADLISKRDSGFFDGSDGALIPTDSGMFTLFKSGGHLKARVLKGTSEPPLIHKNGHLYYKKVKEV